MISEATLRIVETLDRGRVSLEGSSTLAIGCPARMGADEMAVPGFGEQLSLNCTCPSVDVLSLALDRLGIWSEVWPLRGLSCLVCRFLAAPGL